MQSRSPNNSPFLQERLNAPREWAPDLMLCNKYQVINFLGEGGFGNVWQIKHLDWDMDFAVKRLLEEHTDNLDSIDTFLNECLSWIELGMHPNIVACCYVENIGGIPCVFSEYVSGGALHDWIADKKLYDGSEQEVQKRIIDLAIQFAFGLNYAHSNGMIHQDVKPENALIAGDGTLRVSDFGLVRAKKQVASQASQSISTKFNGTIVAEHGGSYSEHYASPEQIAGTEDLTRRTDIFSWAVTLLKMFTGEVYWRSGPIAGMELETYVTPENGYLKVPVPAYIIELLTDCLKENQSERPHDFTIVADRLCQIYNKLFSSKYPSSEPAALEIPASVLNNQGLSLLELEKSHQAEEKFKRAVACSPNHPEAVFNRGLLRWRKGEMTDADLIANIKRVSQVRTMETSYQNFLSGSLELERGDYSTAKKHLSGMKDDAFYASTAKNYCQWISDNGLESIKRDIKGHPTKIRFFNIVSGGQFVVALDHAGNLVLWQIGNHAAVNELPNVDYTVSGMTACKDWVALAGKKPQIRIIALMEKDISTDLAGHSPDGITVIEASPDSSLLMTGGLDGKVLLRKISLKDSFKKEQDILLAEFERPVAAATFSADSKYLAVACKDATIAIWDLKNGGLLCDFKLARFAESLVFMKEGHLVSAAEDGTISFHNFSNGEEVDSPLSRRKSICSLDVNDDLLLILADNGQCLELYDTKKQRCLRSSLLEKPSPKASFACGNLAVWTNEKDICLSSLKTGPEVELLHSIPFMPDKLLVLNKELSKALDSMENALTNQDYAKAIKTSYDVSESVLALPNRFHQLSKDLNDKATRLSVRSVKPAYTFSLPGNKDVHLLKSSHDGQIVIIVDSDQIYLLNTETGEPTANYEFNTPVLCADYAPLTGRLFWGNADEISCFDIAQWKLIKSTSTNSTQLIVSDDGQLVLSANNSNNKIIAWHEDLSAPIGTFEACREVSSLVFSPTDPSFYYADKKMNCLYNCPIAKHEEVFRTNNDFELTAPAGTRELFVNLAGTWLVSSHVDKLLRVWKPGQKQPEKRILIQPEICTACLDTNSTIAALGCQNGEILFIDYINDSKPHLSFLLGTIPTLMSFSPDGLLLFVIDDQGTLHTLRINWNYQYSNNASTVYSPSN